jgi:hypothetical protein
MTSHKIRSDVTGKSQLANDWNLIPNSRILPHRKHTASPLSTGNVQLSLIFQVFIEVEGED